MNGELLQIEVGGESLRSTKAEVQARGHNLARELLDLGFGVVFDRKNGIVLTTAKRHDVPRYYARGCVFSTLEPEPGKEPETMQLIKTAPPKTKPVGELEPGDVFKYPAGEALYQVLRQCGNLEGLYTVGRKSGKAKVWASNLSNGNTTAVDEDKPVIPCKLGRVEWHEA